MKFEEILKSSELNLPVIETNETQFQPFLFKKLDKYMELINLLDDTNFKIPHVRSTKKALVSNQQKFVSGIKNAIDFYYDGHPSKAYEELNQTLTSRIDKFKNFLKIEQYEVDEDFYRIRNLNNNFQIESSNFFHIPFELRGKVSTQRFSIPGFPSLYLGRTIYVCWEELNRPNISDFQTVRLRSKSSIKYLDLTAPFFDENLRTKEYYKYLITWPLIVACSIKVKNNDDIFKPEYIIPQLLLQWIRNRKDIDGIRYWSTHVNHNPTVFKGELYNLVLPVKENKDTGLCNHLKSMFQITETVSWQRYQFALGGSSPGFRGFNEKNRVDQKIETLELIKGMAYPYSFSTFGQLEEYLGFLPTKKID